MVTLFTENEYNNSKSTDLLLCECQFCFKSFGVQKKMIKFELKHKRTRHIYCSDSCFYKSLSSNNEKFTCLNCKSEFHRKPYQNKKDCSGNFFCNRSCAVSYNNKHKSYGIRRSKLEIWLESELTILYPDLPIHFNRKDTINSELDIYFPTLNFAVELNGIFHYEPIYGIDKLNQVIENDKSKTKMCHDNKIDLCIIDVSQQKYVKPSTSKKYLDIITNIIKERMSIS